MGIIRRVSPDKGGHCVVMWWNLDMATWAKEEIELKIGTKASAQMPQENLI